MARKNNTKHDLTFQNVLKVVAHLKEHGWKIEKSQAYNHHKDGLLRKRSDGLFHQQDIEKYAANHLKLSDGSKPADVIGAIAEEKARAERDKVIEQVEQLRIRNQAARGLLVPKDTFERELAQRLMIFKSDMESFCRSEAPDIIDLVAGDKDKIPDLIEYLLTKSSIWLNRYAAEREFIVPMIASDDVLQNQEDEDDAG